MKRQFLSLTLLKLPWFIPSSGRDHDVAPNDGHCRREAGLAQPPVLCSSLSPCVADFLDLAYTVSKGALRT